MAHATARCMVHATARRTIHATTAEIPNGNPHSIAMMHAQIAGVLAKEMAWTGQVERYW